DLAVKEKNDAIALKDKEIEALKGENVRLTKAFEAEKQKGQQALTNVQGSGAVADGKALQATTLDIEVKRLTEVNRDLVKAITQPREDKTAAEIDRNSARDRALELERQVQDLAKQLTLAKATGTSVAPKGTIASLNPEINPPPDNVRGKIKIVEKEHVVL